jgi:hypothetical protein
LQILKLEELLIAGSDEQTEKYRSDQEYPLYTELVIFTPVDKSSVLLISKNLTGIFPSTTTLLVDLPNNLSGSGL